MTFSSDGTSHRSINYDARHVNYKAESYSEDNVAATEQCTRLIGVHSSQDGTSEEAVKAWKKLFADIANTYNQSPLRKLTGNLLRVVDIFIKLTGMHSDHCAKEKKSAVLMEKEKMSATHQSLGEDVVLEKSNQELLPHFIQAREQMIKASGGLNKWDQLSETAKADQLAGMMEKLVIKLGKESFNALKDNEKQVLKLFIWVGCGCHKDLNTVRGGNDVMMKWWKANDTGGNNQCEP